MAIKRGESKNIIVGAATFFVGKDDSLDYFTSADIQGAGGSPTTAGVYFTKTVSSTPVGIPTPQASVSYAETVNASVAYWDNVGFTMNGIEIQFQPDFGEVTVDQILDVAKLYKQGMQVNLNTAFAEATLENLLVAIAGKNADKTTSGGNTTLNLNAGDIGECPVERALLAVGPGTGDCNLGGTVNNIERIYIAHRALSIDNVTVSAKRDEPSMFEVSFRLLPASNGSYGKIVDRVLSTASL